MHRYSSEATLYIPCLQGYGRMRSYQLTGRVRGSYRGTILLFVPGKVFNRVILERVKDSVDSQHSDQIAQCSS